MPLPAVIPIIVGGVVGGLLTTIGGVGVGYAVDSAKTAHKTLDKVNMNSVELTPMSD